MRVSPAPPASPAGSHHLHHHLHHPSSHMSPAVGGPSCSSSGGVALGGAHPSSVGDSRNASNMHAPPYPPNGPPHPPNGPPHGYPSKMGGHMPPSGPPYGQPGYGQQPGSLQYPGSRPQGPMHPYPQNFPPGGPQPPQGSPSSMPPSHPYAPRPPHNNHAPPSQYNPYPHYGNQQGWAPSMGQGPPPAGVMGSGGMGGKGQHPGQPGQPGSGAGLPRAHTPPHYLKQHLHQKMGVYGHPPGGPSAPGSPQMYPNGPGLPPGMGNNRDSPVGGMGGGQNNMPPPTSTPGPMDMEGNSSSNPAGGPQPPAIGPDGNPVLDDASQQSTLSNTSAASGDDRSLTPKPHKEGPVGGGMSMLSGGTMMPGGLPGSAGGGGGGPPLHSIQYSGPPGMGGAVNSHPINSSHPHNSAPSPGATSLSSEQPEFDNINSPGWPRSPSTQQQPPGTVFGNSQQPPPPPDIYRPTKADNIARLYEMSDSPERRLWLDKLLSFMEENKTPITACPTISKNPLDLYALYLHVKERGGFMEVTKNKQWKDVAAVMGIGASSSGSYTLRKHYMKHILAYECRFDRGGIDPQPIINQIEASAKKKTTKHVSVPSPGSSNSQDSFPPAGSNNSSMDGYSNGPPHPGMPPYPPYPPSSDYPSHMQQRPPTQSQPGYQGYQGNQYPGYQNMHTGYSQGGYPPSSGYPPDSRGYQGAPPPGPPNHQTGYQGYQQPGYQRPGGYPPPPPGQQGYQQDQFSKPGTPGSPAPPGQPATSQPYQGPRRHPDFEKQQQQQQQAQPPQSQPPQQQPPPGWRGGSQPYHGYGGQPGSQPGSPQPWSRPNDASGPPAPPGGGPPSQWGAPNRYPPPPPSAPSQSFTNPGRWSGGSYTTGPPTRPPGPGINKNFIVPPPTSFKSSGYGAYMGKQLFPVDSVEAVLPVLPRRKRMTRHNLPAINPWGLLMALRCGLAAEVTWALDTMNILLFDDQTVVYFGLNHMPGLLDCLLEHWRRGLINMFEICEDLEPADDADSAQTHKRIKSEASDLPWYALPPPSPCPDDESSLPDTADISDKSVMLPAGPDFTLISKTGKPVKVVKRDADMFLREAMRAATIKTVETSCNSAQTNIVACGEFVVIGRSESTKHVICSMRSSVPSLPFTRLISSKVDSILVEPKTSIATKEVIKQKDVTEELESPVKIKEEITEEEVNMDVDLLVKSPKSSENSSLKDTCNGPKDIQCPSYLITASKINRNKTSKLDAILNRIKKVPVENALDSAKVPDAKSRLDLLVGNINSSESKTNDSGTKVKVENENNKIVETASSVDGVIDNSKTERKENQLPAKDISDNKKERCLVIASKKRSLQELEEEAWSPDEASLCITPESQDWLARRVLCTGTVLRNLSFIPGNDEIMGKNPAMLALLGRTILLHHEHPSRSPSTPHYDREDDADLSDWCSSLATDCQWWWPYLHHLHESCLVTLCNLSCHLDLSQYPEEITRPVLSGLLHWATCPASYGQDPLPSGGASVQSALSPQRLALEALVKLCVQDQNTDLVLATPPFNRLERLCSQLTRMLCRGEDQVLREFAINLLHYFSAADTGVARLIAMQNGSVSLLVAFIEEAESAAMSVANSQGVNALKENPELMGTSLDMVRRAANTLVHLSKVPDNARVLATCENRLLTLVMSQILDTYVASQLSQVLFNMAQVKSELQHSPNQSRSHSSSHSSTQSIAAAATVVPPPSSLNSQEGPQETPVLVAALSDFTSKASSTAAKYEVTIKEEALPSPAVASSNGPKDTSPATPSPPASNGTISKVEPMEVDTDPSDRLGNTREKLDALPRDKEKTSNHTNDSNSNKDSLVRDKKPSENKFNDSNSESNTVSSNHLDKTSCREIETTTEIQKRDIENNRQINQSKPEKLNNVVAFDKVEKDKVKVEGVNNISVSNSNSVSPKEMSNDTKASEGKVVNNSINKLQDAPSKCDPATAGSVITNEPAVMPSS